MERPPAMERPPPLADLVPFTINRLGNFGYILVLLETPSGYALFSLSGIPLYLPGAMETIWANFIHGYKAKEMVCLHDFQTFEDKSSAINMETGVSEKLTKMIKNWHRPGQTLAVESPEYAGIIQASLNIPCLCDDAVMELMWGLKNVMHSLVPKEKSELRKEDRLPMSQGLIMFLNRYGLVVKPEAVNEQIVLRAGRLYDCECIEKDESAFLQDACLHLMDVSGIECRDWDLLKLSTALKLICFPDNDIAGDPHELFSEDELSKLKRDAHKYKRRLSKVACLKSYRTMVHVSEVRTQKKEELESLIKEAEQAYEAKQARRARECVTLNKRKCFELETTEDYNEAHGADQVEAREGKQAEAQQWGLGKRLKLREKKHMRLIKFNMGPMKFKMRPIKLSNKPMKLKNQKLKG